MVAYSFQPRFVEPILAGIKQQTIRADRKRHARPGETLQLYTGMRTKQCKAIGIGTCELALPVRLDFSVHEVTLGGLVRHGDAYLDAFARLDGFDCYSSMRAFWEAHHRGIVRFTGVLIRWGAFKASTEALARESGDG